MRHRATSLGVLSLAAQLCLVSDEAGAQVKAGPEFRVNTYTTGDQRRPLVAANARGDFVVTWTNYSQDGGNPGVAAQRYDPTGAPRGGEFQVNSYTTNGQYAGGVGLDGSGNFVVVWTSIGQDGSGYGIFGRRFDANGAARGGEFRVNTYTTGSQSLAIVAMDPAGKFVVAWSSFSQDGGSNGVFAQRYDAAGNAAGSEFQVNTYTTNNQYGTGVAMGPGGGFVVVWVSNLQDGSQLGIFAQRHDAAGNRVGGEFRVNTYTTSFQRFPSVAVADNGSFVVAWSSNLQDGSVYGVFARRYDAAGNPQGAEFRVNSFTTGTQFAYGLAMDRGGNFVITWSDGYQSDPFGLRLTPAGAPRGAEFMVNTYTANYQRSPTASSDEVGNFVVAWTSADQDGDLDGVFAQRFGGLRPAALTVDGGGNSVWEPGELAEVKPAWRNLNGAAQSFGGALSNITGPPGPTYTILDGSANYGTLANNTSGPCTDCYFVLVSNPPSRPATHWDAAAVETITPDAHGQQKQWLLHIGNSFTDVPSTNPFYRFVETLLHRTVTGGCGGTNYCPATATTRDQMSVFVLVAKEGAGYLPPACAPPNIFNDVPETSPFCRFIEELSNRGVVSGCGGGNYCPGNPVTREQMAIFVLRTLDPLLSPPACTTPMFADVPASSAFCRWIEELARRGVVTGCGGGNYCPAAAVTREQMGVFLSATFGLTLYGP